MSRGDDFEGSDFLLDQSSPQMRFDDPLRLHLIGLDQPDSLSPQTRRQGQLILAGQNNAGAIVDPCRLQCGDQIGTLLRRAFVHRIDVKDDFRSGSGGGTEQGRNLLLRISCRVRSQQRPEVAIEISAADQHRDGAASRARHAKALEEHRLAVARGADDLELLTRGAAVGKDC